MTFAPSSQSFGEMHTIPDLLFAARMLPMDKKYFNFGTEENSKHLLIVETCHFSRLSLSILWICLSSQLKLCPTSVQKVLDSSLKESLSDPLHSTI